MGYYLGTFLVFHLWSFDRFKCLRWNHGPHSGAFKRIMTYAYLTSIPLIIVYAVGFAVIKYQYGYTYIIGYGVLPTPYEMWSEHARGAILPLYLCFSLAWALEMVTHLEELCFWFFLVNSSSTNQDWFQTLYFKTWAVGSCIATIYMPLVTIFTRSDLGKCEAYTFLAGSLGSLSLTIWFLPVLLTKYHELNCIRVVFRFLFTIPLLILGVDGVRPHQHINDKMFPTDLLAIVACIGVVISSGITLVIFFPRSIEGEMAKKDAVRVRKRGIHTTSQPSHFTIGTRDSLAPSEVVLIVPTVSAPAHTSTGRVPVYGHEYGRDVAGDDGSVYGLPSYDRISVRDEGVVKGGGLGDYHHPRYHRQNHHHGSQLERYREDADGEGDGYDEEAGQVPDVKLPSGAAMMLQPNRRTKDGDIEFGGMVSMKRAALARQKSIRANVNHLVYNWRSPIDLETFSGS
ncbi:hypothetical protein V8B97DRAFT_803561 [Scleroderma yunnanense]